MTENQRNFCKDVARLCEASNSTELYRPIIKLWALYEDAEAQDNQGQLVGGDVGNMSSEDAKKIAAQMTNYAQAKETEENAAKQAETVENEVAVEMNDAANNTDDLAGDVNG